MKIRERLRRFRRWFLDREALIWEIRLLERRLHFRGVSVRKEIRIVALASARPASAIIDDNYPRDKTDPSRYWAQVRAELRRCMEEARF